MEDATMTIMSKDHSLFGIFDGHGGFCVSKFISKYFYQIFTNLTSFNEKKYDLALREALIKCDELLKLDNVNEILKNYNYIGRYEDLSEENYSSVNFTNNKKHPSNNNINHNILSIEKNIYKANNLIVESESSSNSSKNSTRVNKNNNEKVRDKLEIKENSLNLSEDNGVYSFGGVVIEKSNQKIHDGLVSNCTGTTANIIFIKKEHFYISNVGDSYSVLFRNGKATKLNTEHKTNVPGEYTRIINAGYKIINNRVDGKLNLTRAIGDFVFKNNHNLKPFDQAVIVYPEVKKYKITKDMEFIIMACDGVWDCVEPQEFCEFISQKLKENKSISKILGELFDQLIAKTNKTNMGTDNMSCILIQFIH